MALPAVIDPAYASGDPQVLLNGSATLSDPHQHLASYTPVAGDPILAMPVLRASARADRDLRPCRRDLCPGGLYRCSSALRSGLMSAPNAA